MSVRGVVVRRISNVYWVRPDAAAPRTLDDALDGAVVPGTPESPDVTALPGVPAVTVAPGVPGAPVVTVASGMPGAPGGGSAAVLEYSCGLPARLRKERVDVRIGDRVSLAELDDANASALIAEVLPRTSSLARPPIANCDQIVVVFACSQPEFNPHLLDRFLVLAQMSGIPAAIALNKRDLLSPSDLEALCAPYRRLGIPVATTSARAGHVDELARLLEGKVSVFAGPSGVGKSSLLNAFDSNLSLKEGEVSTKLGRGRHTTTFASLYPVSGGLVADTPGYSHLDFPSPPTPPEELGWLFPEIAPWIAQCRLSKCLHETEPGCAVSDRAEIAPSRYESYRRFLDELKEQWERAQSTSSKVETATKTSGGGDAARRLIRIGAEQREDSRRTTRQRLAELAAQAVAGELDEEELDDFQT